MKNLNFKALLALMVDGVVNGVTMLAHVLAVIFGVKAPSDDADIAEKTAIVVKSGMRIAFVIVALSYMFRVMSHPTGVGVLLVLIIGAFAAVLNFAFRD